MVTAWIAVLSVAYLAVGAAAARWGAWRQARRVVCPSNCREAAGYERRRELCTSPHHVGCLCSLYRHACRTEPRPGDHLDVALAWLVFWPAFAVAGGFVAFVTAPRLVRRRRMTEAELDHLEREVLDTDWGDTTP